MSRGQLNINGNNIELKGEVANESQRQQLAADMATALNPTYSVRNAHCHDLTVLSQPDPGTRGHAVARELIEQVILFSARPTLVLPCSGSFDVPCQNVMVAWDGSREAARAVADALPLLRKARQVNVVAWQEKGLLTGSRPVKLNEVCKWLAWHGVSADAHLETASVPIAQAMLSRAADLDTDLVVMGAYGHTRWAERMLGGATRGVLASMTVPVLMSH